MKKRAMRRHHTVRVGKARKKLAVSMGHAHVAKASANALAIRHPFDCGSRCLMCHGDKLLDSGARRQRWKREWS